MSSLFAALRSPVGRAALIWIVGVGGAFYVQGLLVPSPRPAWVYPVIVPLVGALAALQLRRPRFLDSAVQGLVGSAATAWIAFVLLPLPRRAAWVTSAPRLTEVFSLAIGAGIFGLLVGGTYALLAMALRRCLGRSGPPCQPLRFSLQHLFVVVTVLSMLLGWTAMRLRQFEQERKLAERWSAAGLRVTFDYWGRLKGAWTTPNSTIDDNLLGELTAHRHLQALNITGLPISDAGVSHLATLPRLRYLVLGSLPITDAAANQLASIRSLRYVDFTGTRVTPVGIAAFAAERPLVTVRVTPQVIRLSRGSKRPSGALPNLTVEQMKFPY